METLDPWSFDILIRDSYINADLLLKSDIQLEHLTVYVISISFKHFKRVYTVRIPVWPWQQTPRPFQVYVFIFYIYSALTKVIVTDAHMQHMFICLHAGMTNDVVWIICPEIYFTKCWSQVHVVVTQVFRVWFVMVALSLSLRFVCWFTRCFYFG